MNYDNSDRLYSCKYLRGYVYYEMGNNMSPDFSSVDVAVK